MFLDGNLLKMSLILEFLVQSCLHVKHTNQPQIKIAVIYALTSIHASIINQRPAYLYYGQAGALEKWRKFF